MIPRQAEGRPYLHLPDCIVIVIVLVTNSRKFRSALERLRFPNHWCVHEFGSLFHRIHTSHNIMPIFFGKVPKQRRKVKSRKLELPPFDKSLVSYRSNLKGNIQKALSLPAVASKSYLTTISDRCVNLSPIFLRNLLILGQVSWLCVRDSLVGEYGVPVSD